MIPRSPLRAVLVAIAALSWSGPAGAELDPMGYEIVGVELTTGSDEDVEAGRVLYGRWCAQCHGEKGDGGGPMAERLYPRPRDFTFGMYKLRHTFAGDLPTDQDLFASIARGLYGTSMIGWEGILSESEIWQLVHYLKTFTPDFQDFPPEEQVVFGIPLETSPQSVARGVEVYKELQCAKCHGETGRGNGESAEELLDGWDRKIWPTDLTQAWTFRGGAEPYDLYRTFVTGLDGTPMPSYAASVTAEDSWHLVNYMMSLQLAPVRGDVLRSRRVESIPDDPAAPAWQETPRIDFKMAGQVIVAPRLFTPTVDNITVKALFDAEEVALLITWTDRTMNTAEDGRPPDAMAVQFPAESNKGNEKPHFLMGEPRHPVDLWKWSADSGIATEYVARGMDELESKPGLVRATGDYHDGEYRVLMRRARETPGELDIQFTPGSFVPIAFHLWDGANGEEGKLKTISAWYYLLLEPETPASVYAWPVVAMFLGLGAELLVLRRLRRTA